MRRTILAIHLAVALAIVAASSAVATTRQVVEQRSVALLHFAGLNDCQSIGYEFTYTGEYVRTRTITAYYDGSGGLVREVWLIHFDGTETNDQNTDISFTVNGERRIEFDYVNDTRTETGTLRHVTARGEGIVLQQVGRSVTQLSDGAPLFEAGPHELSAGELAKFCAAMAG